MGIKMEMLELEVALDGTKLLYLFPITQRNEVLGIMVKSTQNDAPSINSDNAEPNLNQLQPKKPMAKVHSP